MEAKECHRFVRLLANQLRDAWADVSESDGELRQRFVDAIGALPSNRLRETLLEHSALYFDKLKEASRSKSSSKKAKILETESDVVDTSELPLVVLLTSENGFDLTLKKIAGSNRDDQLRLGLTLMSACLPLENVRRLLDGLFSDLTSCEEAVAAITWLNQALIGIRDVSTIEAVMEKVLNCISGLENILSLPEDKSTLIHDSLWKIIQQSQSVVSTVDQPMSAHYYDVLAAVLSVLVDLTATTIHTEQLTHLIYLSLSKSRQHIADVALQVTSSKSPKVLYKTLKPLFYLLPAAHLLPSFVKFLGFARLLLQWGVASGQDSSFKDQQKIRTAVLDCVTPSGLDDVVKSTKSLEAFRNKKGCAFLSFVLDQASDKDIENLIQFACSETEDANEEECRVERNEEYGDDTATGTESPLFFLDVSGDRTVA
ncbi:uncharacterized protein [Oscarella lobularis]|uniref:uncharacterized protein isoform X2 n=1 Tax=Oscarella lobularis TaxID=121494 RepID=UPI0033135F80